MFRWFYNLVINRIQGMSVWINGYAISQRTYLKIEWINDKKIVDKAKKPLYNGGKF